MNRPDYRAPFRPILRWPLAVAFLLAVAVAFAALIYHLVEYHQTMQSTSTGRAELVVTPPCRVIVNQPLDAAQTVLHLTTCGAITGIQGGANDRIAILANDSTGPVTLIQYDPKRFGFWDDDGATGILLPGGPNSEEPIARIDPDHEDYLLYDGAARKWRGISLNVPIPADRLAHGWARSDGYVAPSLTMSTPAPMSTPIRWMRVCSPPAIMGTVHNFGFADECEEVRLDLEGPADITGIQPEHHPAHLRIMNIATRAGSALRLHTEDLRSSDGDRIRIDRDPILRLATARTFLDTITLYPGNAIDLYYDKPTAHWHLPVALPSPVVSQCGSNPAIDATDLLFVDGARHITARVVPGNGAETCSITFDRPTQKIGTCLATSETGSQILQVYTAADMTTIAGVHPGMAYDVLCDISGAR